MSALIIIAVFPTDLNNQIQIVIDAYDNGNFTLECKKYDKEIQLIEIISFENISIFNDSKSFMNVDNSVFKDLEIDHNGDNIIDRTISPQVTVIADMEKVTNGTSGFELIFAFAAIVFILIWKRKKIF